MIFETVITDEGTGIKEERIPNLFKVFGELKRNISIQSELGPQDNNIGVGLCCSKIIANALKGDVFFLPNQENKTSVSISIPVLVYETGRRNSDSSQLSISGVSEFKGYSK
jgi:K+-sensing histidine kinase KdpD